MSKGLEQLLEDYKDYVSIFAKQIYSQELWSEQTGCDLDEYCDYVKCCEGRLYNFGTWFEHTSAQEYPSGADWDATRAFKPSLIDFHA